ncbi:MAG: glycosyltransferase family 4 protein [Steroidobacteraceae bacterium]
MRPIAILSYDYPPNDGGISRLSRTAAQKIEQAGRDVCVLTLSTFDEKHSRPHVSTTEIPRGRTRRDWCCFSFIRRLPRDAVVVTTVWNPEGTLAWISGRHDLIILAHGNEVMPYPSGLRFRFKQWLRSRVLAAARRVVCNSRYTEGLVRAACPQARTVVIAPGVDAERFRPLADGREARKRFGIPVDRRILLSVSRLDAYKGHDVILRALAALTQATRSQLHYVVAGRGGHMAKLQALADDLGITDCVTWLGFVEDDALPALYACADLFVLCTREDPKARGVEGFGMVFLEAQAAGVPVLGTRVGGIADAVVEDRGGWLVDQDDAMAVSGHLQRLATDVSSFREQGLRGRQRAITEASWETYTTRLLAVIDQGI